MSGVCPTCDGDGCVRCDPDYDPTPYSREAVTAGWRPEPDWRDKHSEDL